MKFTKYIAVACIAALLGLTAVAAFGQGGNVKVKLDKLKHKEFCTSTRSNDEKASFSDLREQTVVASGSIDVDAGRNGGIKVIGEDRNDILVRSCIQTWAETEEAARAIAARVRTETGGEIKAYGPDEKGWSVSFQVRVPRSTALELSAKNGGISIAGVDSTAKFETVNGGVHLENVAGNFTGTTINGGLHVTLDGSTWRGTGLNVTTTNGGIHLTLPATYSARLETGTVNGGFHSNIPALNTTQEEIRGRDPWTKHQPKRIDTVLNSGGPTIRLITTNGGIHISTPE